MIVYYSISIYLYTLLFSDVCNPCVDGFPGSREVAFVDDSALKKKDTTKKHNTHEMTITPVNKRINRFADKLAGFKTPR